MSAQQLTLPHVEALCKMVGDEVAAEAAMRHDSTPVEEPEATDAAS